MTIIPHSPLFVLGIALLGNLVTGMIFFALGKATATRGPTKTVETYDGPGVPF